jgi:hypothetical protein
MARLLIAAILAVSFCAFTAFAQKKDDKKTTIEGTLTCTKCALGETKACAHALIVKEGDKKITYYILDKGGKEKYHAKCCTADVEGVKVTGKLVEKDKKKSIEGPKVVFPKS